MDAAASREIVSSASHSPIVSNAPASTYSAESSSQTAKIPNARLQSVDFLRGVAALAVVITHCASAHSNELQMGARAQHWWFNALANIAAYGREGVPLFFVISGFCIHLRWAKQKLKGDTKLDFWLFWKRRLWRLYPPYFGALCFSMALAYAQWRATGSTLATLNSPRGMLEDFLIHLPMLHGLHPTFDKLGGNVPFWTLAREEYFYLAYFPLLWLRQKYGLKRTLFAVAMLGAVVPILSEAFWRFVSGGAAWGAIAAYWLNGENSALALWLQWCLGLAAIEMYLGLARAPYWSHNAWLALFCAILGVLADVYIAWHFVSIVLLGLTFWILINACTHAETQGRWRSENRVVRWFAFIGGFSYSLYLIHSPMLVPWRKFEIVVLGKLHLSHLEAVPLFVLGEWVASAVFCYWTGRMYFWLVERWFLPGAFPFRKSRASM